MPKMKKFTRHLTVTIQAESAAAAEVAVRDIIGAAKGETGYGPGLQEYRVSNVVRTKAPAKAGA